MDLLKALVAPAIISTIMPLIVSMLQNRKNNSLNYITEERKNRREKIREISKKIEKCKYEGEEEKCISGYLVELQMNINSYGKFQRENYNCDGHIWSTMDLLKNSKNPEEFEKNKELLLFYLSLMLKSDWERSKYEVKGISPFVVMTVIGIISILIAVVSFNILVDWNFIWNYLLVMIIILAGVGALCYFTIDNLHELDEDKSILSIREITKREKKIRRSSKRLIIIQGIIIFIVMIIVCFGPKKYILNTMKYNEKEHEVEIYTKMKLENFPYALDEIEEVFNKDIVLVNKKISMKSIDELPVEKRERIGKIVENRTENLAFMAEGLGGIFWISMIVLFSIPNAKEKKLRNTIEEQKDILFKSYSIKLNESIKVLDKILELKEYNGEDNEKIIKYDKYLALEYKNLNDLKRILKKEIDRETPLVETIGQLERINSKERELEIISNCIELIKKKKNWKKVSKIEDGVKKLKEELEELQNNTQNS